MRIISSFFIIAGLDVLNFHYQQDGKRLIKVRKSRALKQYFGRNILVLKKPKDYQSSLPRCPQA